MDLKDHDHEITKGPVIFKSLIYQSAQNRIKGKHGEIEVRIAWR